MLVNKQQHLVHDTNDCLNGLFKDIKGLYARVIQDMAMQFKGTDHLLVLQEMASIILGEDLFEEKLYQIFNLENPDNKKTQGMQKTNIHDLVIQLQQDLQKKADFFTTYLKKRDLTADEKITPKNRRIVASKASQRSVVTKRNRRTVQTIQQLHGMEIRCGYWRGGTRAFAQLFLQRPKISGAGNSLLGFTKKKSDKRRKTTGRIEKKPITHQKTWHWPIHFAIA